MRVIIEPDYAALSKWAAKYVADRIVTFNPTEDKPFVLGCPTGSSPIGLYKELIEMNKQGIISFRNVITFNTGGIFGHSYDEDVHILERVHYSGNWDVLRPAREVYGVNPITDDDIDALLQEAERIMDKLRVTA